MGEYASKGVAGTGLGLGIAGTALSLLNNNGGLNNILGSGNHQMEKIDELQAKIAEMNAEKYANNVAKEVYIQSKIDNDKINSKFEVLAQEIANIRVRDAQLRGEINTNNAQLQGEINTVAQTANNGISILNANIQCLQNTVAGITKTVVPINAVCPQPMPQYNSWTAPTTTTTGA